MSISDNSLVDEESGDPELKLLEINEEIPDRELKIREFVLNQLKSGHTLH